MQRFYARTLRWSLAHRPLILGVLALSLVATIGLFGVMPEDFLPADDSFIDLAREKGAITDVLPLARLTAVIVMDKLGFTLNTITLGGLAIAIGEVVDDAIIDVENIYRRLRENRGLAEPKPVLDVVLHASIEVRSAVI